MLMISQESGRLDPDEAGRIESYARTHADRYIDDVAFEQSLLDRVGVARGEELDFLQRSHRAAFRRRGTSHTLAIEAAALLFATDEEAALEIVTDMWRRAVRVAGIDVGA